MSLDPALAAVAVGSMSNSSANVSDDDEALRRLAPSTLHSPKRKDSIVFAPKRAFSQNVVAEAPS